MTRSEVRGRRLEVLMYTWLLQGARAYATNQYYDNVVGRDTMNMRFYNEIRVVSIPTKVQ